MLCIAALKKAKVAMTVIQPAQSKKNKQTNDELKTKVGPCGPTFLNPVDTNKCWFKSNTFEVKSKFIQKFEQQFQEIPTWRSLMNTSVSPFFRIHTDEGLN